MSRKLGPARQLFHVTDGAAATDAVNVAQLQDSGRLDASADTAVAHGAIGNKTPITLMNPGDTASLSP